MGYVVITPLSGNNLKNRALLFSMDPFVKCTAAPSGATARCEAVAGGGRNPRWNGTTICLKLADGDTAVVVEAWNQNAVTPAQRVGGARVDVGAVTADAARFDLPLDTGGEIALTARRALDAEERDLERAVAASLGRRPTGLFPASPFSGGGDRLGGGVTAASAGDRRAAAAAAAEQRAGSWRQGGGGGAEKRERLSRRRERDDLAGKITALYAARGEDAPIGLAASDAPALKRHLEKLRGDASRATAAKRVAESRSI